MNVSKMITREPRRDRVRIEALEIDAPIGVYAHERGILQKLSIDVSIDCDLKPAGETDALEHAIDYDRIAALTTAIATEKHHALIETVAHEVASRILRELGERAYAVHVRVAKPSAIPGAKCAAVEVWREQSLP
jgi:dihydroneopterin aldolase